MTTLVHRSAIAGVFVALSQSSCVYARMEIQDDASKIAGDAGATSGGSTAPASGGTATSASAAGGATSSATAGASAGTGCTGNLESVMIGTNLCVAKSVAIADAAGSSSFAIDATEVTRGQYEAWTATSPNLPSKSDTDCGATTSYLETATCMSKTQVCKLDCDHHPVVCVDWCSAQAYCKAVGKRLCGKVGGGANAFADQANANASQWYRACSSGGVNAYPYGNVYSEAACVSAAYWSTSTTSTTTPVASVQTCQSSITGYLGVFDLSGNVMEWEDSCASSGSSGGCRLRGGSFEENSNTLECGYGFSYVRTTTNPRIGFRCCRQ